jgi:hypothetical protein
MTTKQLIRCQARWAEIIGCFEFDIVSWPGHEAVRPDTLSQQKGPAPNKAKNSH